ncbi:DnaB-like helicase N-terminal domain-containing protein [Streptomyces altiplanensis]
MTPLVHAEQAVLGAIFLEPGQLDRLSPWLRPEHFSRPVHTAIYAAMLQLKTDGHPAAATTAGFPVPLAWVTDTLREASTRTRGLTASYLHSLASACPRPDHAPVYGRMVLEGAIHRSVAQRAARLHQAALADGRAGTVEETLHHAQVLTDVLADLARGWGTEARPVQPPTPYAPLAERRSRWASRSSPTRSSSSAASPPAPSSCSAWCDGSAPATSPTRAISSSTARWGPCTIAANPSTS